MFSFESPRLTVTLAVWFILLAKVCVSMKELTVEEGKSVTLACSGNYTRRLRNIWWTSNNRVLSKCYIGNERCINVNSIQFSAKSFHRNQEYTTMLTIHNTTFQNRDQVFKCVDDGSEPSTAVTDRSFKLQVYHIPESPICEAAELSRGRMKILCKTPKVFPNIICEISQEIQNVTDALGSSGNLSNLEAITNIQYSSYPLKDREADYNTAVCSAVLCSRQPGQYRFKVKMYPNVTNSLVASVDGYTNIVTIRSPDQSCEIVHQGQSNDETKDGAKMKNAAPFTGEQNSKFKETIITEVEEMAYTDKDIIRRQLIVILILACLLVCNFLFNIVLKVRCRRNKRLYQDQV